MMDLTRSLLLFSLLLGYSTIYSQRFEIEFQQCYGGSSGDVGKDIFLLPDSTFLVTNQCAS